MAEKFSPWLAHAAEVYPGKTALQFRQYTWTYAQLYKATGHFAQSMGIERDSRIAIISVNCPEQIIASHGIMLVGGTVAHINHRLSPAEIAEQVKQISPDLVLFQENLNEKIPETVNAFSLDAVDLFMRTPLSLRDKGISPDATCAIFMTSGTTGTPKAVQLSYRNFIASAISSALNIGINPEDRWLACLPLDHIGGFSILTRSAIYGTAVELHSGFDPDWIKQSLAHNGTSLMSLVPTMLQKLLDIGVQPTESLRAILLGGGRIQKDLVQKAWDSGLPVLPSYGLTEACSQVTTLPPEEVNERPDSAGKPLPMTEIKIISEDGEESSAGKIGEIHVKSPKVMNGYLNDPEATRQSIKNNWLTTGDSGHVDADGFLYPVSRRSDLIVSGGENIYPVEVESALSKHPDIKDVCVFGIDDEKLGQKVAAAIVLKAGLQLKSIQLTQNEFPELASYKFPKEIVQVKAIPKTSLGKPKRRILQKRFSAKLSE
ncbi:MAG: 2-succinylbenzoate--CoA ligase [Candidatus Marinimicrobia bacterium]|nr:2-succinylbenzoate--CoA ligase [Candidatus Neomarinimicrobiota bacterium]